MKRLAIVAFACIASLGAAFAQATEPPIGVGDPRIRVMQYDPNQVVSIAGHLGYQMVIQFGANERIENVSIGDSVSWQVTPNRAANLLFVKPVELASTNMTVVTNLRSYVFDLTAYPRSRATERMLYQLSFSYPVDPEEEEAEAQPVEASPQDLNLDYSFSGNRELRPARVFDDGRFTYFQFAEDVDVPAIFVIGVDGGEELVNRQVRGEYTVVDRVAGEFVLRYGRSHLRVRNDDMRPAQRGFRLSLFNNRDRQEQQQTADNAGVQ